MEMNSFLWKIVLIGTFLLLHRKRHGLALIFWQPLLAHTLLTVYLVL